MADEKENQPDGPTPTDDSATHSINITPPAASARAETSAPGVTEGPPPPPPEKQILGKDLPRPPSDRPVDEILRDPLGEVARKERRSLLGLCTIALLVGFGGLVPTEITNLGLKFSPPERMVLLVVFGMVVLYYLAAFSVYAYSDWLTYRHVVFQRNVELRNKPPSAVFVPPGVVSVASSDDAEKVWPLVGRIDRAADFRLIFDFFVPLLAALLALLSLGYGVYQVSRNTTPTTGGYSHAPAHNFRLTATSPLSDQPVARAPT